MREEAFGRDVKKGLVMDKSVVDGQLVMSLSELLNDKKSVIVDKTIVKADVPKVYTIDGKSYWYNENSLKKQMPGKVHELLESDAKSLGMYHTTSEADDEPDVAVELQETVDQTAIVAQSMVVPVASSGLVGLFLAWLKKRKKKRQKRFTD